MYQFVSIKLKAPNTFFINLQEIHQINGQLIAVSQLSRPNGFALTTQGTKTIEDSADVETNSKQNLTVKHYVIMGNKGISPSSQLRQSNDYKAVDKKEEIPEHAQFSNKTCLYDPNQRYEEVPSLKKTNEQTKKSAESLNKPSYQRRP